MCTLVASSSWIRSLFPRADGGSDACDGVQAPGVTGTQKREAGRAIRLGRRNGANRLKPTAEGGFGSPQIVGRLEIQSVLGLLVECAPEKEGQLSGNGARALDHVSCRGQVLKLYLRRA